MKIVGIIIGIWCVIGLIVFIYSIKTAKQVPPEQDF
jgi:hypothetical protein